VAEPSDYNGDIKRYENGSIAINQGPISQLATDILSPTVQIAGRFHAANMQRPCGDGSGI
jgi:hypothetical protein